MRLGPADVKPYMLLQLDEAGTFGQGHSGGQAAGFNPRRVRLGAEANVADQWQFGLIWNFGGPPGDHSHLFEAKVAYTGLKPLTFASGVFKPAFTLEYAQSAADLLFLKRASIVNVVGSSVAGAGRVVLGQAGASRDRWFATALVTGGTTGPGARSDQRALLGRAAGLMVKDDNVALHLGASGAWVFQPPRGSTGHGPTLSFSNQPELQIDGAKAPLSTGSLDTPGAAMGGIEVGLGWGRLWVQGEWYGIGVERHASDGGGLFFSGWYAQAAYTLLGTPRLGDRLSRAAASTRRTAPGAHWRWARVSRRRTWRAATFTVAGSASGRPGAAGIPPIRYGSPCNISTPISRAAPCRAAWTRSRRA